MNTGIFSLLSSLIFWRIKRNYDIKLHGFQPFHFLSSLTESGHQEAFTKCSEWEKIGENDEIMTVQHNIERKR